MGRSDLERPTVTVEVDLLRIQKSLLEVLS